MASRRETLVIDPDAGSADPEDEDATPEPSTPKKPGDDAILNKAIEIARTQGNAPPPGRRRPSQSVFRYASRSALSASDIMSL